MTFIGVFWWGGSSSRIYLLWPAQLAFRPGGFNFIGCVVWYLKYFLTLASQPCPFRTAWGPVRASRVCCLCDYILPYPHISALLVWGTDFVECLFPCVTLCLSQKKIVGLILYFCPCVSPKDTNLPEEVPIIFGIMAVVTMSHRNFLARGSLWPSHFLRLCFAFTLLVRSSPFPVVHWWQRLKRFYWLGLCLSLSLYLSLSLSPLSLSLYLSLFLSLWQTAFIVPLIMQRRRSYDRLNIKKSGYNCSLNSGYLPTTSHSDF